MATAKCRISRRPLEHTFVDLGMSPLANAFLTREQLDRPETFYPLRAYVCEESLLVQLEVFEAPDKIFRDYAYYASYSESWLRHARDYTDLMVERFGFGRASQVIEVASNDGYLLRFFREKGIPVLGVDPAANVAEAAERLGVPTVVKFFNRATARELAAAGRRADLLIGNNVLAQVPDLHDFVAGLRLILQPGGILTMEFPHLLQLMRHNQFDTIYHEHYSYFSFLTAERIFAGHGITLFDVEELPTHGGSLRIYGRHEGAAGPEVSARVARLKAQEVEAGLDRVATYLSFGERVKEAKRRLLGVLLEAKARGKSIVGYGAPAKGNTLLNYCGIRADMIDYTVDASPHKQGLFLPGTHIPVLHPDRVRETRPDYLLILPWNLREEVMAQMSYIRDWGGQFMVPIPEAQVYP